MRQSVQIAIVCVAVGTVYVATHAGSLLDFGSSSSTQTTRFETLANFDGVELVGSDDVVIKQGARYEVRAEGDAEAVKHVEATVRGGVLHISRKHEWSWSWSRWHIGKGVTVHVTLPTLNRVALTGTGDLSADKLSGEKVSADLKGTGDVRIGSIEANKAYLTLTGTGDLRVDGGKVRSASYSVSGPGDLDAESLQADAATVDLRGTGGMKIHAASASGDLRGTGDIQVVGAPSCNITVKGTGDVQCP